MNKIFYHCATDPRIWVYKNEKRRYLGVTLNFAHAQAWAVLAGMVAITFAVIFIGLAVVRSNRQIGPIVVLLGYAALSGLLVWYCFYRAKKERAKYELFDIYDHDTNQWCGVVERKNCHGNPALLHRTSHVVVFATDFKHILLQKRLMTKDIQPGKWDTAVGGHLELGESYEQGARRELREELGLDWRGELVYLFESQIRNEIESENTGVFGLVSDGPFHYQTSEIETVAFWSLADLADPAKQDELTAYLRVELGKLKTLFAQHPELRQALETAAAC